MELNDLESFLCPMLDFEIGKRFESELLRSTGMNVHAPFRDGNRFFLLATFRRYLFQLHDHSVSLALQSCLGGFAEDFQVSFQSHNHCRFSVSCKSVGFKIYELRHFTGRSFDVYFHLWSNGAPQWEREKRLWEEEEEAKLWSVVLSKRKKKEAKKKNL